MSPTLSVCLMTDGPGPRVAALLELLRPHADQLVVALDDRSDPQTEALIAEAADTVIRYRYHEYNRTLPWLFSLCQNDWILNIDGDEIPSVALLEELSSLVAATDVTHYWLLRKWLWPDAESMIAEHPWTTDYQLRLVRNDPLLLTFPSETHRPICMLGPHRFVRAPLYHADTILSSFERRELKAQEYEAVRPGKRVGGGPMNHVFYLPECRDDLRIEPLPDADAEVVRGVLGATARPVQSQGPSPVATEAEVDRLWAGRLLVGDDRQGSLEWLDTPARMTASEHRTFDVRVGNLGSTLWPWGKRAEPGVRLAYQWLDLDGAVSLEGVWTPLPADLAPGQTQVVPLHVDGPPKRGRHRLRVDLIQEHVGWFGNPIECDVEVLQRLRVALVGDAYAVARTLEQLAEDAPEFEPIVLSPEPAPIYGPAQIEDLRDFLLDSIPRRSLRDLRLLIARTLSLVRAARRVGSGVVVRPLPSDAQTFLGEVGACSHLLLVGGTKRFGTRELWVQLATVIVARELGVEVIIQRGATARPHGVVDSILLRKLLRGARVVEPGELGLASIAAAR